MSYVKAGSKLTVSGKSTDGKIVIGNIFRMVESQGIPLQIILKWCDDNNYLIDWIDFYHRSRKAGWNIHTTLIKIEEALVDFYGRQHADNVIHMLKAIILKELS